MKLRTGAVTVVIFAKCPRAYDFPSENDLAIKEMKEEAQLGNPVLSILGPINWIETPTKEHDK